MIDTQYQPATYRKIIHTVLAGKTEENYTHITSRKQKVSEYINGSELKAVSIRTTIQNNVK
jgi:hypothetical protein